MIFMFLKRKYFEYALWISNELLIHQPAIKLSYFSLYWENEKIFQFGNENDRFGQ